MHTQNFFILGIVGIVLIGLYFVIFTDSNKTVGHPMSNSFEGNTEIAQNNMEKTEKAENIVETNKKIDNEIVDDTSAIQIKTKSMKSTREIFETKQITLPLSGSAPTENVLHSVPIEEIRRGCFRQDCIPSIDDPVFVSVQAANDILPDDTVGIGLIYKGEKRFYPFNMLVTHEIVNDVVAGDPILVTYCPLCGTGVVFDRTIQGTTYEFGVSGMLWQSNLLMYNRASDISDRNLWSQVLGEAVVGVRTGTKLKHITSNIVKYTDWRVAYPDMSVLNTGSIRDPYGGNYYDVARNFAPNFDESNSPLDPSAYIYGVEIDGSFKAYPRESLPVGSVTDTFANEVLTITKSEKNEITITDANDIQLPVVSGFWFSWIAAHPDTELWNN